MDDDRWQLLLSRLIGLGRLNPRNILPVWKARLCDVLPIHLGRCPIVFLMYGAKILDSGSQISH